MPESDRAALLAHLESGPEPSRWQGLRSVREREAAEKAVMDRKADAIKDLNFAESIERSLASSAASAETAFDQAEADIADAAPSTSDTTFEEAAAQQDAELQGNLAQQDEAFAAAFESSVEAAVTGESAPDGSSATDVGSGGEAAIEQIAEEPTVDEDTLMADFKVTHGGDFDPNSTMDRGKLAQLESARMAYPNETSTQIALRIYRGEFD